MKKGYPTDSKGVSLKNGDVTQRTPGDPTVGQGAQFKKQIGTRMERAGLSCDASKSCEMGKKRKEREKEDSVLCEVRSCKN